MREYTHQNFFENGELIKITKNIENHPTPVHTHNFIEIVYIFSGSGVQRIDNVEYPVKRGSLMFINYGQTHSFDSENLTYYNVLIRPEAISDKLIDTDNAFEMLSLTAFEEFAYEDTASPYMHFDINDINHPEPLILKMYEEYNSKLAGSQTVLGAYAVVLLTYIFRSMFRCESGFGKELGDITAYISEHLSEKITLQSLAEKCFYSPKYFSRIFKECFGTTVTEYIQKKRIGESARLLSDTNMSVEEIGRKVGYDDSVRFYKYFKKHMNRTPLEYRKSRKS